MLGWALLIIVLLGVGLILTLALKLGWNYTIKLAHSAKMSSMAPGPSWEEISQRFGLAYADHQSEAGLKTFERTISGQFNGLDVSLHVKRRSYDIRSFEIRALSQLGSQFHGTNLCMFPSKWWRWIRPTTGDRTFDGLFDLVSPSGKRALELLTPEIRRLLVRLARKGLHCTIKDGLLTCTAVDGWLVFDEAAQELSRGHSLHEVLEILSLIAQATGEGESFPTKSPNQATF